MLFKPSPQEIFLGNLSFAIDLFSLEKSDGIFDLRRHSKQKYEQGFGNKF
jgi:hypothetical protein